MQKERIQRRSQVDLYFSISRQCCVNNRYTKCKQRDTQGRKVGGSCRACRVDVSRVLALVPPLCNSKERRWLAHSHLNNTTQFGELCPNIAILFSSLHYQPMRGLSAVWPGAGPPHQPHGEFQLWARPWSQPLPKLKHAWQMSIHGNGMNMTGRIGEIGRRRRKVAIDRKAIVNLNLLQMVLTGDALQRHCEGCVVVLFSQSRLGWHSYLAT